MKNVKYIILPVLMLTLISCEDFLDRAPLDQIGTESYWTTANDLENYMLQFYPKFPTHAGLGGMHAEDVTADNVIAQVVEGSLNGEETLRAGRWTNEWADIRSINIFFDSYKAVKDPIEAYGHFLGEAYFFKAWFYFDLLKKYGDVPWYSTALYPNMDDELLRPRDPRTLVADSILASLDKAVFYLDKRNEVPGGNNRVNKEAALAFKTRVALYEGSWQKYHQGTPFATAGANPDKYFQACVSAAEELMNGSYTVGVYSTGNPEKDYYDLFGKADMSKVNEILLYRAYNAAEGLGNNVQHYTTFWTGFEAYGATWQLIASYLGKEGTPYDYEGLAATTKGNAFLSQIAADCDTRLKSSIWIPGDIVIEESGDVFDKPYIDKAGEEYCPSGFQIKKFSNPSLPLQLTQWGSLNETGYILLRYGEVLLNYAEAKYELDGIVATEQLNMLRERVDMPDFTVNSQNDDFARVDYGYPVSDALYEIRRERRVELALEGRRTDDYRRWAAHNLFIDQRYVGYPFDASEFPDLNPLVNEDGLLDPHQSSAPNGYQFRPDQDYLLSIPQDELVLNPNLVQNPGW